MSYQHWKIRLPRKDTGPEDICRAILEELNLSFISNESVETPFRDYPIEADFLVEHCLVIEVQSHFFHDKARRVGKDRAKREAFTAMGLGVLWLWDDELRYADQVKRGKVWRPFIKAMVTSMLMYAHKVHAAWLVYMNSFPPCPSVKHPDLGLVEIRSRLE